MDPIVAFLEEHEELGPTELGQLDAMLDQLDHRVQATYELPFRRLKEKICAARVRLVVADPDGVSLRALLTARFSARVCG